ncbi:MAG: protein-L-isoaspartate(D-aspartate) O-methyltransferase [Bacteroidales bacterium]|nr:protein-L-isoaspartate(D-aspartate) O-methyltransferase [Bacteroidales bacterium]MBN2756254.1 protein-L-isoaspartate(D-aspartate) O-methyltransferase [Bacteroidales bacterium]
MDLPINKLYSQDYDVLRKNMVEKQIERRGVSDKNVLKAMLKVERHLFVPQEYIESAYDDNPLPIGEGQTISQPFIVAYMTELLNLDSTKNVLEIGTGSGYQAAILAEIAGNVYSIELIKSLSDKAKKVLDMLNYQNIKLKVGDGYLGWKEYSPFDAIIVTCAPTHIPKMLKDQLAEGGIIIIPVGEAYSQEIVILKKEKGKLLKKETIGVRFVPMKDEKGNTY